MNWIIKPPDVNMKIFNENDFENLVWHDVCVQGFYFDQVKNNFILLIDYILEWIKPEVHQIDNNYRHWQIPAVMIFKDINNVTMNLNLEKWAMQLIIDNIIRKKIKPPNLFAGNFYRYEINFSTPVEGKIVLPIVRSFNLHFFGNPYLFDSDNNYKNNLKDDIKKNIDFLLKLF